KLATLILSAPDEPIPPPVDARFNVGVVTVPKSPLLMSPPAVSDTLVVPLTAPSRFSVPEVAVRLTVAALTVPVVVLLVRLVAAVTTKLPRADEALEMLVEPAALMSTLPVVPLALKLATSIVKAASAPMLPPVDVRLSVGVVIVPLLPFSISPLAVSDTLVV